MHPTYRLALVQALWRAGSKVITWSAKQGALTLGFDDGDIECVILGLTEDVDFYKSMPAEKRPGWHQDVYRTVHEGKPLYLKVQLAGTEGPVVLISFKRDESR
jgi:hypothetical protein